jgi:hypothetical protein
MDVEKHFSEAFGMPARVTNHAYHRITQRLTMSMLKDLQFLIKAGLRGRTIASLPEHFAFVDTRYNLGLIGHKEPDVINIGTIIHGKPIDKYHDCQPFAVRIDQEKHMAEVEMLRAYQKQFR